LISTGFGGLTVGAYTLDEAICQKTAARIAVHLFRSAGGKKASLICGYKHVLDDTFMSFMGCPPKGIKGDVKVCIYRFMYLKKFVT
jgi:hypothetical protein